jgi:hypothetical protein
MKIKHARKLLSLRQTLPDVMDEEEILGMKENREGATYHTKELLRLEDDDAGHPSPPTPVAVPHDLRHRRLGLIASRARKKAETGNEAARS